MGRGSGKTQQERSSLAGHALPESQTGSNVLYEPARPRGHRRVSSHLLTLPDLQKLQLKTPGYFENCLGFSGHKECFALSPDLPYAWKEGSPEIAARPPVIETAAWLDPFNNLESVSQLISEISETIKEDSPVLSRAIVPLKITTESVRTNEEVVARSAVTNSYMATAHKTRIAAVETLAQESGSWYHDNRHRILLFLSAERRLLGGASSLARGMSMPKP